MTNDEPTTELPYELAYEVGLRAIDNQLDALTSLETRAGSLIAAIAITTSFLGGIVIEAGIVIKVDIRGFLPFLALVAFVIAMACCLAVLKPRMDAWRFSFSPGGLIDDFERQKDKARSKSEVFKAMAREQHKQLEANEKKLREIAKLLRRAVVAVTFEIAFWMAAFFMRG